MDKRINNLKRKIVKLEDFFQDMASIVCDKAGLKHIHFLTPDNETGDFITTFSTSDLTIRLSKKDFTPFNRALEIFYPGKMLWGWGLWKQVRYFKVIWKIYVYGISVVMPIRGSNGVCCLVVFCDRKAENWFNQNSEFVHTVNQHISFCLEAVRLYNQTLEGVINKYDPSHPRQANQPITAEDEPIPSLVERKVEFL